MQSRTAALGATVVSAAAVSPVLIWMVIAGPRWAGDTPTYAAWADALIGARFHVLEFLRSNTFTAPLLLYLGWIMMVALAKVLGGGMWPWLLLGLNGVAVWWAARTTWVSMAGRRSLAAAAITAVWVGCSPDVWVFGPLILGDLWFTALSTAVIGGLLRWPRLVPIHIVAIAALASITRPVTAPLIVCVALVASGGVQWFTSSTRTATAVAVLAAAAIVIAHAWAVTGTVGVPSWLQLWFERLRDDYAHGVVIVDRPDTFVAPAQTLLAAVMLTLRKWVYFFSPWLPGYSARHVAVNLLWFVPLYAAIGVAIWRAPDRLAVHVLVAYIVLLSGFHALQQLDFDHRYRIPALPAMVMLAGLAFPAHKVVADA
jgi:hypothetical protein